VVLRGREGTAGVVRQLAELRQLAQDALADALAAMKRAEAEHDAANDPLTACRPFRPTDIANRAQG
jgi:hypothetical protein